jgi:hypothetical protein
LRDFSGFTVANVAAATVVPDIPVAADVCAVIRYRVSANNPSVEVQVMPSADSRPRRTPAVVSWDVLASRTAATDCRGALLWTTTALVTATFPEPSVGVMTTRGATAVGTGGPAFGLLADGGEHDTTAIPTRTAARAVDISGPRDPHTRGGT